MIQIPDNVRRPLELLARYHFWLLAVLVPLVLLPLYFVASWDLDSQMASARRQIEDRLNGLQSVEAVQPHPNENWAADINAATTNVKRETFREWVRFWESEAALRVWPAPLGEDFTVKAAALKPDGRLSRKLLERYQNGVREIVRGLPRRMGAEEAMLDRAAGAAAGQPSPRDPSALVVWDESDQQRIFASFNWEKPPSTLQVLLAQEELWVYGLFCDSIARVNRSAAGRYNAPIPLVQQLSVGYPAAEESPGGAGASRIRRPAPPADGQPAMVGAPLESAPPPPEPVAPAVRPPNPRFTRTAVAAAPAVGPDGLPVGEASPDDPLRNWVYVDFEGRPQDSATLGAAVESQMVHLMPFVLRIVVDQRKLDTLLEDLATKAEWPIDVRQIRINVGGNGAPQPFGPDAATAAAPVTAIQTDRPYDIQVELRGTVALATPPNETVLGLEPAAVAVEPAATETEQPPAGPPPAGQPPAQQTPAEQPPADQPAVPQPPVEQPSAPPPATGASNRSDPAFEQARS